MSTVNFVAEVNPNIEDSDPSCHVCGAVMVPTRFNCRSCGATTEPTEAAPPSEREAREMLQRAEEFLFTKYSKIGGNLKMLVPILADFWHEVTRPAAVPAAGREWIPCDREMPEVKGRYLVDVGLATVHIAELCPNLRGELRWFRDGGNGDITNNVTHWQPLPIPRVAGATAPPKR